MEIVSRTENKLLSRVEIDFKWNQRFEDTFEEGGYGSRQDT